MKTKKPITFKSLFFITLLKIVVLTSLVTIFNIIYSPVAHASLSNTFIGGYVYIESSTAAQLACRSYSSTVNYHPASQSCRTSSNTSFYINGRKIVLDFTQTNVNYYNLDDELIQDDTGDIKPGHPNYPTAPDISSCTRSTIPYNTGTQGNRTFPSISDTWTDSDGCQYQIDTTSGNASDIVESCQTYDGLPEIWCDYKTQPTGTVIPPTEGDVATEPTSPSIDVSTPAQEETNADITVDWSAWEPDPTVEENRTPPNDVITVTMPDGGTIDITVSPDGTISIDGGTYQPSEIPITVGSDGKPAPNPNYNPQNWSPGGNGPGGDTGGGDTGGGDGSGDGDGNDEETGLFCEYAAIVCDFIDWVKGDSLVLEDSELPIEEIEQPDSYSVSLSEQCPQNLTIDFHIGSVIVPFEPLCQYTSLMRPFIIGASIFFAGFILLGVKA